MLDPPTVSSPYDAAISGYGKASGEIGLLQRKRHLKRLKTTVEMLNSGQGNASYSTQRHDQLVHLKHKLVKHQICSKDGCLKTALPLTTYCKQRILHHVCSGVCLCGMHVCVCGVCVCVCACVHVCVCVGVGVDECVLIVCFYPASIQNTYNLFMKYVHTHICPTYVY